MAETMNPLTVSNSALLTMAPGANLSAYVQAVGGIAVLSAERERELGEPNVGDLFHAKLSRGEAEVEK